MALKNNINTYADMAAYNADGTKEYPNVSYIIATDEVVWMESEPIVPKAIYNVTSTSSATTLLNSATGITKQIIDGVEQESVQTSYIFSTTGEHEVEYEYANNEISDRTFQNCINLTSITIPNSVTSIGELAFFSCGFTSITIPDSVTSIGQNAFYNCRSLTNVTIGNGDTSIGQYAFYQCSGLTSITIPDGVTSIGGYVFQNCTNLANVTVEASTPPTLGNYVFDNNASGRKIYVPSASVSTYQSAYRWSVYANDIEAIQNS